MGVDSPGPWRQASSAS